VSTTESRFLRACRREPVDRTPVWFMRQAGRSLPEYRAIKARHSLFEITRQPELCAEVTLQPVRRLGVDAAILYSDIMLPLAAVGVELELVESVGPVLAHPSARVPILPTCGCWSQRPTPRMCWRRSRCCGARWPAAGRP